MFPRSTRSLEGDWRLADGSVSIQNASSWFESIAALRGNAWAGAAIGLALFAVALGLRWALEDALSAFPFLTFFPAIMLTALMSGAWAASGVTVLAALAAWLLFMPGGSTLSPSVALGLLFFVIVAGVNIALVELLHAAVTRASTERRRVESLLAGRDAMYKELQHRVANNMQFVSALLTMQQRALEGSPAADALAQAASRLRAMSRIHRRLHDPANAERAFGPLVEELCHELLEATGAKNIVCRVDIPAVPLAPDRVHALAMIVTEAMTNAVKHAFADGRPGTIRVSLERLAGDEMDFVVADDGPGLAPGYNAMASPSLGMRIMQALAQQLDGVLSLASSGSGAELRVRFQAG